MKNYEKSGISSVLTGQKKRTTSGMRNCPKKNKDSLPPGIKSIYAVCPLIAFSSDSAIHNNEEGGVIVWL